MMLERFRTHAQLLNKTARLIALWTWTWTWTQMKYAHYLLAKMPWNTWWRVWRYQKREVRVFASHECHRQVSDRNNIPYLIIIAWVLYSAVPKPVRFDRRSHRLSKDHSVVSVPFTAQTCPTAGALVDGQCHERMIYDTCASRWAVLEPNLMERNERPMCSRWPAARKMPSISLGTMRINSGDDGLT